MCTSHYMRSSTTTEILILVELEKASILSSSYTGGPRYMQQADRDAIAVVTFCHEPDLFITSTANPR